MFQKWKTARAYTILFQSTKPITRQTNINNNKQWKHSWNTYSIVEYAAKIKWTIHLLKKGRILSESLVQWRNKKKFKQMLRTENKISQRRKALVSEKEFVMNNKKEAKKLELKQNLLPKAMGSHSFH